MNKFRQTGKGGILCALGGTLIAADTLYCIRASPTHAPSYLCLHRFDDYVIICKLMKAGLVGLCSILDQRKIDETTGLLFTMTYPIFSRLPRSRNFCLRDLGFCPISIDLI